MSDDLVWVSGSPSPSIHPLDRGFLLGDGVFDTLVAFAGTPFAGNRHLERLTSHAAAIGLPLDAQTVRDGWADILSRAQSANIILRTTASRGRTERGLWPASRPEPTIVVTASPWHAQLLGRDIDLIVSATRRNADSPSSRIKSLGYLDNVLAAREAAERGAHDALFLTHHDRVACTTIANIFAVSGSNLLTPPVSDGVLAGIMRGLVLEAATSAGLNPVERSLSQDDLRNADAVFLTNSVRLLWPVTSIDGQRLSAGDDIRMALQHAIFARILQECGFDLRPATDGA